MRGILDNYNYISITGLLCLVTPALAVQLFFLKIPQTRMADIFPVNNFHIIFFQTTAKDTGVRVWVGIFFQNDSGIVYKNFQKVSLREKRVSQYRLLQSGIDNKTLDSLKKNKNITLLTLEKLCDIIGCTPNDIVQFRK